MTRTSLWSLSVVGLLVIACLGASGRGAKKPAKPTTVPTTQHALRFDREELELTAGPGQKQLTAEYQFANTGPAPVRIMSVSTSHPSLVVSGWSSDVYRPGQSGKLAVTYTPKEGQEGPQQMQVMVYTDQPWNRLRLLGFKVRLPQVLALSPAILYWTVGGEGKAQNILAEVKQEEPVKVVRVSSSLPQKISAEVAVMEAGRRYEIRVKPASTLAPTSARLEVQVELKGGEQRTYRVIAVVARPGDTPQEMVQRHRELARAAGGQGKP